LQTPAEGSADWGVPSRDRPRRVRSTGILLLLALVIAASGCAEDDPQERVTSEEQGTLPKYPLPFGLEQVDGTEPIGRPLTFDDVFLVYDGVPVPASALRVAYRVTGDPEAVLREWAEQLASVGVGDVRVRTGDSDPPEHAAWAEISAWESSTPGPGPGWASVELWATSEEPILLVSIDRHHGVDAVPSDVVDPGRSLGEPRIRVDARPPEPGEPLFDEQGDVVHVPEGARALMPMLPTIRGTGGSTTLLAAADEEAVIQRMLDEAVAQNDFHEVSPVEVEEQDGVVVTTGHFVVPAGGWDLRIVAVRVPGEPDAMLWVQSAAD